MELHAQVQSILASVDAVDADVAQGLHAEDVAGVSDPLENVSV